MEPVAAAFYNCCEWLGLNDLLPRTAEQAAVTYYIMSLILFVVMRFVCTAMMKYVKAYKLLIGLALLAVMCCLGAMFGKGSFWRLLPDGHFWLYVIDVPDHLWFWSYRFGG